MSQHRWVIRILVACLGLLVASCGHAAGTAVSSGSGSLPAASDVPGATADPAAPASEDALPAELVGTWSGGNGRTLTFGADGRYQSNSPLGEGRATVSGGRITLTPDGREPVETTWSVSGGKLYLGTSVYLRDDAKSGSLSLVGTWIELNGYATFRFAADGTYDFSDPAHGRTSQGTYDVDAGTLTLQPRDRPPASFGLAYDGTSLTFTNADGTSAGEYVRAG